MADHGGHTADHGASEIETGGVVDYEDHAQTYRGFLRLLKWITIGVVILVAFLAWYAY